MILKQGPKIVVTWREPVDNVGYAEFPIDAKDVALALVKPLMKTATEIQIKEVL